MNFAYTAQQEALRQQALEFGARVLEPGTAERCKARTYTREDWNQLAEAGYTGMLIPQAFGGTGLSAADAAVVLEALATTCSDTGLLFSLGAHLCAGIVPLLHHGNNEQKNILHDAAAGKCIVANAITEAGSGANAFALRSTAILHDDNYTLNGHKVFCTNAPLADAFVVYALTDVQKGFFGGISAFLLNRNQLETGPALEKNALLSSPAAEVLLNDVKVNITQLIGKSGAGVSIFMQSMNWERTLLSALHVGSMQLLLNKTRDYVKLRETGNGTLSQHQAVQFKLADMAVAVETSRLLVQEAAQLLDAGKSATAGAARAKIYVSEAYCRVAHEVVLLHGGNGITAAFGLSNATSDAQAACIYSGPNDVLRGVLASQL